MDSELRAELELAIAELAFWLDFAKWWRSRHCTEEEPRIDELLAMAEQRYHRAALRIMPGSLEPEPPSGTPWRQSS